MHAVSHALYIAANMHSVFYFVKVTFTITSSLCRLIIRLAHQLFVIHEVELISRGKLPSTYKTGKALQVVDVVLCSPHNLCRGDRLIAASALGAKFSVEHVDGGGEGRERKVSV